MPLTVVRYREPTAQPHAVVEVENPREAILILRNWQRAYPGEVIVLLDEWRQAVAFACQMAPRA
jgi:hypothetical protein